MNQKSNPKGNQKSSEIKSFNLEKFANQLSGISLKEKKERESLYKYPDSFPKSEIGNEKGKKYRNALRNKRDRIINNLLYNAKFNPSALNESIKEFDSFYKENYLIQSYKIESISNSGNADKNKNIILALDIILSIKGNAEEKKSPAKKGNAVKK